MSVRLSEREKLYYAMILFPIFWPFIPVVAICDLAHCIVNWWSSRRIRKDGTGGAA